MVLATNCALMQAMKTAPFKRLVEESSPRSSVMTRLTSTESLLDGGNSNNGGAPLGEVVIEQPAINITPPARFTESTKMGILFIGAGMAAGYGLGGFIIGIAHDGWVGPTIGTCFLLGGGAATYGMVKLCQRAKQIHTQDVADLDAYIPHAQEAIINHRALPYHMNIPDTMLNNIYSNSKKGYKDTLSVSFLITSHHAKEQVK